jgi:hypothetical protein
VRPGDLEKREVHLFNLPAHVTALSPAEKATAVAQLFQGTDVSVSSVQPLLEPGSGLPRADAVSIQVPEGTRLPREITLELTNPDGGADKTTMYAYPVSCLPPAPGEGSAPLGNWAAAAAGAGAPGAHAPPAAAAAAARAAAPPAAASLPRGTEQPQIARVPATTPPAAAGTGQGAAPAASGPVTRGRSAGRGGSALVRTAAAKQAARHLASPTRPIAGQPAEPSDGEEGGVPPPSSKRPRRATASNRFAVLADAPADDDIELPEEETPGEATEPEDAPDDTLPDADPTAGADGTPPNAAT